MSFNITFLLTFAFDAHSSALFFYDYALTIPQEVNLFWRGGFSGATVLFLSNRYLHVLHYILVNMVEVHTDAVGCFMP